METATAVLDSFDSVFERFELCTKQELLKIGFLVISFILGTVDMVTDWINWKQWSTFGGYSQYYFMYIFQTAFLCAAVVGTILWTAEAFLMIKRSREFILRYQQRSSTNKMEKLRRKQKRTQKSEHTSWLSRVGFIVRLLIGLMEDLPVVILIYYSPIVPFCGVPAKQERYSPTTIAAVASSMLNSTWTMFILYWDLFECNKKMTDAQCCCTVIRSVYEQISLCVCFCGCCGCATTSNCDCLCLGQSRVEAKVRGTCKLIGFRIGRIILFVFIFLLYLTIFIVGGMTLSNVFNTPVLDRSVLWDLEYTSSIKADKIGPGLDSRQDAAMFVTMVYELPNSYHVGLYDNRNVNIANSASVYQIQNRLYIGQFNELEHLKDGTLTKVITCSRIFPFLDKIDESLFNWKNSRKLNRSTTDIFNCKMIFRLRYYPNNNNWNPFINFVHEFYKDITVEWGIYIEDHNTCPIGFRPLPVSSLLTESVKQDIVNYTCSLSCINATDICRNATYGQFEESDSKNPWTTMTGEPQFYLTVNDQQTVDSCHFKTYFKYTSEFCDKYWGGFLPVKVPEFVKHYPQFITIPMTYKKIDTPYPFLDSKCSKVWAEGEKLWF